MKTSLNFDDRLIRAAKTRAAQDGETLTRLTERALRDCLLAARGPARPFRAQLLTKRGRPVAGVNLDDRNMQGKLVHALDLSASCSGWGVSEHVGWDREDLWMGRAC